MSTISEARAEVYHEMHQLISLAERRSPQTATEVEVAPWSGVLRVGGSIMRLSSRTR